MLKILFIPVSVTGGLIAGLLSKKAFENLWSFFDTTEAPDPKHRDVSWKKVAAALALEGAIFRLSRGLVDRAARVAFWRSTGRWPGEARPET